MPTLGSIVNNSLKPAAPHPFIAKAGIQKPNEAKAGSTKTKDISTEV
jgi:hypothetical protein